MNIPNDGGWGKSGSGRGAEGGSERRRQGSAILSSISALSKDWVLMGCLALTASLFLGIGLLAARQNQPSKDPLWIEQLPASEMSGSIATTTVEEQGAPDMSEAPASDALQHSQSAAAISAVTTVPAPRAASTQKTGKYVASKTGTKYYLPTCGTAKRIKDMNKVWFPTKVAAEAAGYQPAANCKGL